MSKSIDKTIIVSGPKRSGGTLLTRLFDSQPGIIHFIDEAFFWEHVYNYQERGQESLFIDAFKHFGRDDLMESFIDRDILPWLGGVIRGIAPVKYEVDLHFKKEVFLDHLAGLKRCTSIPEIWNCLVNAYAHSFPTDYSERDTAYMFIGDMGRSILSTKKVNLKNCRCIFFIRNPYHALDSLKKARMFSRDSLLDRTNRKSKTLHPINFAEVIKDYYFFWNNRSEIVDERTVLIRFEDLVAEPEKTMRDIADHVGIEFTDNLLKPTLCGQPHGYGSSFEQLTGVGRSVLSRKIQVLNESEISFIGKHLKPILDYFDYKM
ncbi:MAG: hypothetical protein UX98_C0001G0059 [Parcubacteria group bacterium GW2011_GWA2_47_26]|nr:MAG: hypothetical protein UX98_C0001G0059 [Parcubacteria group bacterium GW2011_GWA2_47_26]